MTSVLFETGATRTKQVTQRDDDVDMARDRALITRAQDGDRSAFDELYVHYSRRLYRLCLRRLSDPHEAEDVAQEAFVRAWRALPRFCGERRFYPWLSVIAANLCTDVLRKRSRSTPVAEFYGADPDTGEEVDDRLLHQVDAAMVSEALTHLTERHQRILALREGSGMSYQAIAEHEGVAISAVETLLWRARQALKREFCALAEAAEGKGAALAGLGLLGRFLSHVLRAPGRTARRVVHLTPASAAITVASISAVGALAVGATHVAVPDPGPGTAPAGLATHAFAAPTGPGGAAADGRAGPAADLSFLGFGAPGGNGTANTPGPPGTSGEPGRDGADGPATATGANGGSGGVGHDFGSGVADGPDASSGVGAGLGGLLATIASGSSSSDVLGSVGSTVNTVTKGVTGATGAGSVGSTLNSVTKGVTGPAGAGSVGSTLNSVAKGVTGATGTGSVGATVNSATQVVSNAASSVGSTVNSVAKGVTGATGAAANPATGVVNAAVGGSSPVLGGAAGSPSPGSASAPGSPAQPTAASGGGVPLPVGIGGLFG